MLQQRSICYGKRSPSKAPFGQKVSECSFGFAWLALARGGEPDSRLKDAPLVFLNCFSVWLFKDVALLVVGFWDARSLVKASVLLRGAGPQQHTG